MSTSESSVWRRIGGPRPARPAWVMWAVFAVGIAVSVAAQGSRRSVVPEYARAADLWWASEPLYTSGVHGFLYLPQGAMVYSPFLALPRGVAEIAWRVAGLALLAVGVHRLCRGVFREDAGTAFLLTTPLVIVSALGSATNGQTNIHIAAFGAICCADLIERRWWRAAMWLMLALACKPTAIVLVLLVGAVYWRPMAWRLAVALCVFALAPFVHPHPGFVAEQYHACMTKMAGASQPGDAFQDFRGLLIELGVVRVERRAVGPSGGEEFVQMPPEIVLTLVRGMAAVLTLGLCVLASRRFGRVACAVILCTLGAIYLTLFNPRTEGLSYIILGLPAALWAVREFRDRRWWRAAFFVFFALSTQFSTQIALNTKNYWVRPVGAIVFGALVIAEVSRSRSRWDERARAEATVTARISAG